MMDYLTKILNKDSNNDNIDTKEELQFSECDKDLSDKNLEEENQNRDAEINTSNDEITENNSVEWKGLTKVLTFGLAFARDGLSVYDKFYIIRET